MDKDKLKQKISGFEEQEILIDLLAEKISSYSKLHQDTIKLYVTDALSDALEKRNTSFKKMKSKDLEERNNFVKDIVAFSIKRATLIASFDKIYDECIQAYEEWKNIYRK